MVIRVTPRRLIQIFAVGHSFKDKRQLYLEEVVGIIPKRHLNLARNLDQAVVAERQQQCNLRAGIKRGIGTRQIFSRLMIMILFTACFRLSCDYCSSSNCFMTFAEFRCGDEKRVSLSSESALMCVHVISCRLRLQILPRGFFQRYKQWHSA